MFGVLSLMTLGIIIGYFISNNKKIILLADKLTGYTIFLLLFLLGIGVGLNQKVIDNLPTLGIQALLLSLGAIFGSLICAYITYKLFFKSK